MYVYTPGEIEGLTGWHTAGQRDLRLKGYLANYGQKGENGRWLYSARDVVAFYVASILHERDRNGVRLHEIFAQSWTNAEHVAALASGKNAPRYFVVGYMREKGPMDGAILLGAEAMTASSFDEISAKGFYAFDVFDLSKIAELLPASIAAVTNAMQKVAA